MHRTFTLTGLIVIFSLWSFISDAQKNIWKSLDESKISAQSKSHRVIVPNAYKTFSLDFEAMTDLLSTETKKEKNTIIELPMPDGSKELFTVEDAPIFAPKLAAKYPGIRSFKAHSIRHPHVSARLGYSQKGFHAMILSHSQGTVFIDSYSQNNTSEYISYYRKDYYIKEEFVCNSETHEATYEDALDHRAGDCQLRTYRLALACTGEYATFHGGTVESVLAEYNVAMTRVNGIYEKDLGITMILIDNTDELIYLNGATDPYTNNSGSTMLGENQNTIDNVIGAENYDIGHVFSTGGGGIASLRSPCNNNNKARGVTGLGSPVGDPFYVDYVCHEMGHQFGANHTQNNNCNRSGNTAMEPGSGNTIMGYAGICDPNSQNFSDDHFHAVSIGEIANYIVNGNGGNCPVISTTANNAPSINIATSTYNLPIATPFALTADATDIDGDLLTYNWEQMDNEVATMPPLTTNTGGPAFVSRPSTESNTRYFPLLTFLVNNQNPEWEVLPFVSRVMNFRCTVRDNNLLVGCTDEDDIQLNFFDSAGPFLVESPNTAVTWNATDIVDVTWDVAGTDQAPINCANVDILLSTDGGFTYDIILAQDIPNNGSYSLTVPDVQTEAARIQIKCSDNVFFDISNEDFIITTPFSINLQTTEAIVCIGDDLLVDIDVTSAMSFSGILDLAVSNLPGSTSADFAQNSINIPGTTSLTISNIDGTLGYHDIQVTGSTPDITINKTIRIYIATDDISTLSNTAPVSGSHAAPLTGIISWTPSLGVLTYDIEIARDPLMTDVIDSRANIPGTSYNYSNLLSNTVYYWRLKANSPCLQDPYSAVWAFQTGGENCTSFTAQDTPIEISDSQESTVFSRIQVASISSYDYIKCFVGIDHSWIGDLIINLSTPDGSNLSLADQIGVPADIFGCDSGQLYVTFFDDSENTNADLEATCDEFAETYQAITPFSSLAANEPNGLWELTVQDVYGPLDGGQIATWNLQFCQIATTTDASIAQSTLFVNKGLSRSITQDFLSTSGTATGIIYTVMSAPTHGTLEYDPVLSGNYSILGPGDTFTQEDINTGKIQYLHNGDAATVDLYTFDVIDNNLNWSHNQTFNININQESFAATALIITSVSCNGGSDGSIFAEVLGGIAPYEYSLNNGPYQSEDNFNDLPAGTYTITIKDATELIINSNQINLTDPSPITINTNLNAYNLVINTNGGAGGYTYSLDGITYQAGNTFLDVANNTYTIYVQDSKNCIETTTLVVDIMAVAIENVNIINAECANESTGALGITATGGVPPYQYSLDGIMYQNNNTFTLLPAGDYTLYVLDAGGKISTQEATITDPEPLSITTIVDSNTLTVSTQGGTAPYMYSINGVDFQSENTFNIADNGEYTLYISDANNCGLEQDFTINALALSITYEATDIDCNGNMNGSILVNALGGIEPYNYSIDGTNFQNSNSFDGLSAGTYEVYVQDKLGDIISDTNIIIIEPDPVTITIDQNTSGLIINAMGGTGNYEYSYDGGVNFWDYNEISFNGADTIEIIVRDELGCVNTETIVIIVTDVSDLNTTFGIQVYPNPVADILTITNGKNVQNLKISLIDNLGRLMMTQILENMFSYQIDLRGMSNGVYHLVIESDNQRASTRIVKIEE